MARARQQNTPLYPRLEAVVIERAPNINSLWAALIVEELVRSGVDTFCVAPGSRSTPLTVAVARHERASTILHYDERGAAFHGLGYARATGKAAAIITTSGTALANVWPAVVEASLDRIPLIILNGDRPPELQDTGANQTIDQIKFFGDYVRWHVTVACPALEISPTVLLTTVDQAVHRSAGTEQGPVHMNCMFREPLAPTDEDQDFGPYLEALGEWLTSEHPYTRYHRPSTPTDDPVLRDLAALANDCDHGMLVVGRLGPGIGYECMAQLAAGLKWPLLPDITSGIRLGGGGPAVVPNYDVLLASPDFRQAHRAEIVIQVGGRVTSKLLLDYLEQQRPRHHVVVANYPGRQDPTHTTTLRLDMPVDAFGGQLLPLISERPESSWLSGWQVAADSAQRRLRSLFGSSPKLTEPLVAWLVSHHIDPEDGLFLASSMPVRDMDAFADCGRNFLPVEANRGASGIDGTIASAAGFARGLKRRVTLLIGDLAFLHDINSLGLLRSLDVPLVIVLINNDGGGIFSFLPIAAYADVFESHFGTPHGISFGSAAGLFGLDYACPDSVAAFVEHYQRARRASVSTLLEVRTDREENVRVHRLLRESMLEDG